jgi:hypothetical protein
MAFLAWKLINNDPVPSGCDHKGCGTTDIEIDGGTVTTCDFYGTVLVVTED